jgi:hypothetical protein
MHQHHARTWHLLVIGATALLLTSACGEDDPKVKGWDGGPQLESGIKLDLTEVDLGAAPDGLPNDPKGPTIVIQSPKQDETVIEKTLKVVAKITDPQGVDDPSVKVQLQGAQAVQMNVTVDPTVYEALLDISAFSSNIRLWIVAADQEGNKNSAMREFKRDPGPTIVFFSPVKDSRWKSSVTVKVLFSDKKENLDATKTQVRLGSKVLSLKKDTSVAGKISISGTVKFDDFSPKLSGNQVLVAESENKNGAKASEKRAFVVDDQGPTISVTSHTAGDLIGSIITIKATVKDLAGVLSSSVVAVIGNNLKTRQVTLTNSTSAPNDFEGVFDTRTLDQYDIWPVISVRAADTLGNESHQDIQVGLDNGQPIIELDPPRDYFMVQEKKTGSVTEIQCSTPFDPVGYYAANDGDRVPQIQELRVQIEDQGNHAKSAKWVPYATVDKSSVWLYVLDDTTKALVVDTDGDGYCDDINPKVIPLGSKPVKGEAVAVALKPISPNGVADFMAQPLTTPATYPGFCDDWGAETKPAETLCLTTKVGVCSFTYLTGGDCKTTKVIPDPSAVGTEPAIYSIPPIAAGTKSLTCMGLPFDFKANAIDDGWACVAVVAKDKLGNRGVSPPLRIKVDKAWASLKSMQAPDVLSAPNCTGTLDKKTGTVTATACKWRDPRANAPATCSKGGNPFCSTCAVGGINTSTEFPQKFHHCRGLLK